MSAEALTDVGFRLLDPDVPSGDDGRFRIGRADGSVATLVATRNCPLEAATVDFGSEDDRLRKLLTPLLDVPRMSTLGIGGALNLAVRGMDPQSAYVNVGVWHGFTLLAAMAGNEDRICVGVDNFSEFGGPRAEFIERFEHGRGSLHSFHDMDYADFLAEGPEAPIGVYLYDGNHSYRNQYLGLMRADPHFADDALIVVDDTNLERAREATLRFAEESRLRWDVVIDRGTASVRHPTLWNGLMVLQAGGGPAIDWPTEAPLATAGASPAGDDAVSVIAVGDVDTAGLAGSEAEVLSVSELAAVPDAIQGSSGAFVLIAPPGSRPDAEELARAVHRARSGVVETRPR
jgi:hypothetical protein